MIGWFDGRAGASGDMMLGALVGAGVPLTVVSDAVDRLDLGIGFRVESVERGGVGATRVHVEVPETRTLRHLGDIVALLAVLDPPVRDTAIEVFVRLARAEAAVHHCTIEEVHFHEVGALDAIADVVGVCAAMAHLGLDHVSCSTLSLGSGSTRGAHGPLPIPAPAVLALLTGVAAVAAGPAPFEATTPTGAALLATFVDDWGPLPPMVVQTSGAGAGATDTDVVVNALRVVIGEPLTPRR